MYQYENGQFKIQDYNQQKPFASFLPGIAGIDGIPMWAYYTNRGQGIAGFGVENKNGAIMDFVPANVAYRRTEQQGFRTFIKIDGKVHECFSSQSKASQQTMIIEANSLAFEEIMADLKLKITVKYFTASHTKFPGLIRKVSLENLSDQVRNIEIVDGLPVLWPYKNDDAMIKTMANLAVAWFDVKSSSRGIPFYQNRSTTTDSAAVGSVQQGHFYASYHEGSKMPLDMIYDTEILFGQDTSLKVPVNFESESILSLLNNRQIPENKLPCAFTCFEDRLKDQISFTSLIGKADSLQALENLDQDLSYEYLNILEIQAKNLVDHLTNDVHTQTGHKMFDAYIKQSYLDNFLRGGYPLVFEGKEGPMVYHVYSRIHGDMEREYNDFYVEPAYYSHGTGNFRDVNQNRRNDVYFEKEAGLYNIRQFTELLQMDGQNPLSIKGSRFIISKEDLKPLLVNVKQGASIIEGYLEKSFTPGGFMMVLDQDEVVLKVKNESFLKAVLKNAIQENQAAYGHGFWVDHWTYNMDLIDNYLNVFPDRLEDLLYKDTYKYFRSPERVLKRKEKYVITSEGKVRQYDALYKDVKALEAEGYDLQGCHWINTIDNKPYTSNFVSKYLCLVINKMTNFDPSFLGIMMNSDKPGWNDAMNGLPGLFGSGMSEVIEIKRVIEFLIQGLTQHPKDILLIEPLKALMDAYVISRQGPCDYETWDTLQTIKETYLDQVHTQIASKDLIIPCDQILKVLEIMKAHTEESIERAKDLGHGIMPSYLIHEAKSYDVLKDRFHPVNGLQVVEVTDWELKAMPLYLEAPARYLKQSKDKDEAQIIYHKIKNSGMYDKKLKMYVTSESLEEESLEIGRARAFTPGWLERESVFMHMSYKYLLGLLKSGLYENFYEAIATSLPPFMDPKVYGRSTLENSSFIASSRNPNPKNHGRGFVSRLTGTTSEVMSMWRYMMFGPRLFEMKEDLTFSLQPKLSKDFFDDKDQVKTRLFKTIEVIYKNPKKGHTFGENGVKVASYQLNYHSGQSLNLKEVIGKPARDIRNQLVHSIVVNLK